ncbi:MAG: Ig-like domain repeat protein [Acidobacteriota bacterium]|nr:Ig-like domain repeat protein [Acidobacteriota bacterium]
MGKLSRTNPMRALPVRMPAVLSLLCATLVLCVARQMTAQSAPAPTLLHHPAALLFDAAGNLYVAESAAHRVRRFDPTGNVTTIAGNGTQGVAGDGGAATAAELDTPQGLALDPAGSTLYIADTHNQRIRALNLSTGIMTTVAGNGSPGFSGDGGPATAASLAAPVALAISAGGKLAVADSGNSRVREIDLAAGTILTVAGSGTQGYSGDGGQATAAALDTPTSLAYDAAGNLYLADTHNQRIRRVDTKGVITTVAGAGAPGFAGDGGAALAASLAGPTGISVDSGGNLYFADAGNQRIRRVDATTGAVTTVVGEGTQGYAGDGGPATAAMLDTPRATAFSPAALLTLADAANQRIRQRTATATLVAFGTASSTSGGSPGPVATTLTLSVSPQSAGVGVPVTLTAQLAAAGGATPSGSVTFLDAQVPFASATLDGTGRATLTTTALAAGTHTLTAFYAGSAGFAASTAAAVSLTVTAAGTNTPDFSLAVTSTSNQTTAPGVATSFSFTVQASPALTGPITLAVSGLPTGTTASFSPAYVPPGGAGTSVTLTLTPPAALAGLSVDRAPIVLALLAPLLIVRRRFRLPAVMLLCCVLLGCGDRIRTAGTTAAPLQVYPLTITATTTAPSGATLQHTLVVTLNIQPVTATASF